MGLRNVFSVLFTNNLKPICGREWIEKKIKEHKEKKRKNRKTVIQYLKEFDETTYEIVDSIERFFKYVLKWFKQLFKQAKEKNIFYSVLIIISGILSFFLLWFITYIICI